MQIEFLRLRRNTGLLQHPAPALHLVFIFTERRSIGRYSDVVVTKSNERSRFGFEQNAVALGSASVQVHGNVRVVQRGIERCKRRGVDDLIDNAAQFGERRERDGSS